MQERENLALNPIGSPFQDANSSPSPEGTPGSLLKQQYCPSVLCKDCLPAEPHLQLQLLLEQAKKEKITGLKALEVCVEIKKNVELMKVMPKAKQQKWPTSIDFEALPKHLYMLPSYMIYGKLTIQADLSTAETAHHPNFSHMQYGCWGCQGWIG